MTNAIIRSTSFLNFANFVVVLRFENNISSRWRTFLIRERQYVSNCSICEQRKNKRFFSNSNMFFRNCHALFATDLLNELIYFFFSYDEKNENDFRSRKKTMIDDNLIFWRIFLFLFLWFFDFFLFLIFESFVFLEYHLLSLFILSFQMIVELSQNQIKNLFYEKTLKRVQNRVIVDFSSNFIFFVDFSSFSCRHINFFLICRFLS